MRAAGVFTIASALCAACFNVASLQQGDGGTAPDGGSASAADDAASGAGESSDAAPRGAHDAAATDGSGSAPPFCSTLPAGVFCDDFDQDQATFPTEWLQQSDNGGSYGLDSTEYASPPNSLLLKFSSSPLDTWLRRPFSRQAPASHVDLAFQLKPVATDALSGAVAVVAAVDFYDPKNPTTDKYTLQFTLENTGNLRLEELAPLADGGSLYVPHEPSNALAHSTWTEVHLSVTSANGRLSSAEVTLNGVTVISAALSSTLDAKATDVQLTLGGSFATASTAWQVAFDNVSLAVTP